jgi:hypothetical protein
MPYLAEPTETRIGEAMRGGADWVDSRVPL